LWNVLIMNNALHIKENNEHDFDFWSHVARFLWPQGISRLPLWRLTFHLWVIPLDPRLIARDDFPHKVFIWLCFLRHVCCHRQTPFLLSGSENSWNKFCSNTSHVQILRQYGLASSIRHSDLDRVHGLLSANLLGSVLALAQHIRQFCLSSVCQTTDCHQVSLDLL